MKSVTARKFLDAMRATPTLATVPVLVAFTLVASVAAHAEDTHDGLQDDLLQEETRRALSAGCAPPPPPPTARQPPGAYAFILLLILNFLSGTFSGLNLGLMSLTEDDLNVIIDGSTDPKEVKWAKKIMPLRKRGNLLLCTLLIGNTLVNVMLAVLTEDIWCARRAPAPNRLPASLTHRLCSVP